jgi:hypothetical protein
MGVEIFSNENGAVFVCNTTEWAFGPRMPGENVAEAFLRSFGRGDDPRNLTDAQLESRWADFQQTKMSCPYGHYMKADVTCYAKQTIFECMEKGCKARWNLDGQEICSGCDEPTEDCDCD